MINYLRYYGPHFSKKMCEFAASLMTKENDEPIKPATKEDVRNLLTKYDVKLKHDQLYDSTYILDMIRADFYGDSIEDELHTVRYIKNVIDDPDAPDGLVFNRFYSDCCYKGIAIPWDELL